MKINNKNISFGFPPYIVAELSANHNGSVTEGFRLIDAAKDCGANAVKIQCYTADSICNKEEFKISGPDWTGQNLYDLYKSAETPPKMVKELFEYARKHHATCFASVFDFDGADFVVRLGSPALKIASFELVDTPLIEHCAGYGLPMIISTGMGTTQEIKEAVCAYDRGGPLRDNLALLHCISSYPAKPGETNLPALGPLSSLLGGRHIVGFSDHTLGIGTSVAAIAFGASIIEKHLTLDRSTGGPDSAFSLEPNEMSDLVDACRDAWEAIQPRKGSAPVSSNRAYRKSLFLVKDVSAGDSYSKENVRILRPAAGLAPCFYQSVLAGVATRDLKAGTPLSPEMVSSLS
jgi:pseudaminic acid synthase